MLAFAELQCFALESAPVAFVRVARSKALTKATRFLSDRKAAVRLAVATPVGAKVTKPAQGMDCADQNRALITIAIGDAVVMGAALANFGALGFCFTKTKLRSQNMELTLVSMPAGMVSSTKTSISPLKASVRSIHRSE